MKRISLFLILIAFFAGFTFPTGDCSSLIYFKEGSSVTMTSYDADGKLTGSTKTVYTSVKKSPAAVLVTAQQESFNKKGKSENKSEYTLRCEKGILYFDMKSMMPSQQQDSQKDFEMSMEGNDKEMPANLVVGSSLKDSEVKFKFKTKDGMDMSMMNMSVKITNRKIEAKEKVTTPAGSFECYKISENVESKTMFSIKMKSVSWFNEEVGTVKSESYKESGKLMGKTELTEYKK